MSEQYKTSYKSSPPQIRSFSTTARQQYQHDPKSLTDQEYYQLADNTLNHILHDLEEQADINPDIDVEYSDGVMNVTVSSGTYVINRQPPSKQIWLSSPLSGPKRFDFVDGIGWVYKDGTQRIRPILMTNDSTRAARYRVV